MVAITTLTAIATLSPRAIQDQPTLCRYIGQTPNAENSKYAYVVASLGATQSSHLYLDSAMVLSKALQEHKSAYPLAVIIETGNAYSLDRLSKGCKNCFVCEVQKINASQALPENWQFAMSKLYSWNLLQFKKVVFLDADTLPLSNIDDLFQYRKFSMAPNWCGLCCKSIKWGIANSGTMVLEPDATTFELLIRKSFLSDLDDQNLISSTIPVNLLPDTYSVPVGYAISSCGCQPSPNATFLEQIQKEPIGLPFVGEREYFPGVPDESVKVIHFFPEKGWKFLGKNVEMLCGSSFFRKWEAIYNDLIKDIGP